MSLPSVSPMRKQWTVLRLRIKGLAAQNGNVRSDAPDQVSRGDFSCDALSRGFRGVSISLIASAGLHGWAFQARGGGGTCMRITTVGNCSPYTPELLYGPCLCRHFLQLIWSLVSFQFTNRTSLNQQLSEVATVVRPIPMKRSVPARTPETQGSTSPPV
jgi:hypothetical protein